MASGFWGKIPARGDFVGAGLSRDFVVAWDAWMSASLADALLTLGDRFVDSWLEAPVWRFAAASGLFGAAAVSGLWMPSADRAGRFFPLVIAADCPPDADWLTAAETAGRAALSGFLDPESLSLRIPAAGPTPSVLDGSIWWTEGAPRVAAAQRNCPTLPRPAAFASMLDDAA